MRRTLFIAPALLAMGALAGIYHKPLWAVVATPLLSGHAPSAVQDALCHDYCRLLDRAGISSLVWQRDQDTGGQRLLISFQTVTGLNHIAIPVEPALFGDGQIISTGELMQLQTIENMPVDYVGDRETYLRENAGRLIGLALDALSPVGEAQGAMSPRTPTKTASK